MSGNERDENYRDRLKSALWYAIGKTVDDESLGLNVNATPQFIGALTEMVWNQAESVAKDLESFSLHANRSTINTDDVLLLCRRNEELGNIMKEFVEKEKAERNRENPADRSTVKGKGKPVTGKGRAKK